MRILFPFFFLSSYLLCCYSRSGAEQEAPKIREVELAFLPFFFCALQARMRDKVGTGRRDFNVVAKRTRYLISIFRGSRFFLSRAVISHATPSMQASRRKPSKMAKAGMGRDFSVVANRTRCQSINSIFRGSRFCLLSHSHIARSPERKRAAEIRDFNNVGEGSKFLSSLVLPKNPSAKSKKQRTMEGCEENDVIIFLQPTSGRSHPIGRPRGS